MSTGVVFDQFSFPPALNDSGQTAFFAGLNHEGVTIGEGFFSEGDGSLKLVVRVGDQAPGTPNGTMFYFSTGDIHSIELNNAGQIAFVAHLSGGGVNDEGVWSEGAGSLALVVRKGDQAPGMPNDVRFEFLNPGVVLNDNGQTAFLAEITGSLYSLWSEGSGSLALVARTGSSAPGTPVGVNFERLSEPALNNAGQTAFWGVLTGGGVIDANNEGVWSESTGSLALVAREGEQAAGQPAGVTYGGSFVFTLGTPGLNNAGQVAFLTRLTGGGVTDANNGGIWSDASGSLGPVAREGDQAPGTPAGVRFGNSIAAFEMPPLNNAGHTAFSAFLTGTGVNQTNSQGVWVQRSDGLTLVAREGEQSPGTPAGVTFGVNGVSPPFLSLALNDAGQIAFMARLTGVGVGETNNIGIWATDQAGVLQLIVRLGDSLEVAPGDLRTISDVSFRGTEYRNVGRRTSLNNRGQLAFLARFTDGSEGIFVSDHVAILPLRLEPSSIQSPETFRFRLYGSAGSSGQIQRSDNLQTWTDWMPFNLGDEPIEISDPSASTNGVQFYRAVSP